MLKSLEWKLELPKKEAIQAWMRPKLHMQYQEEVNKNIRQFKESVALEEQKQVEWKVKIQKPTIVVEQDGYGSLTCALLATLKHFGVNIELQEFSKLLQDNGYVNAKGGVIWQAVDIVPEVAYGIESRMLKDVYEMSYAIEMDMPIIAMVSSQWLQKNKNIRDVNQAVVIWYVCGKNFVVSTTMDEKIKHIPINEFLSHVEVAWAIMKVTHM